MKTPFSLFLALRYLRPKRTFLSVITVLSVLGVTLGITALVVVISVMTGFDRSLQRAILGFEPHLNVTNDELLPHWRDLVAKIKTVPGVQTATPYVQGPVLIESRGQVNSAILRGIEVKEELKLGNLAKFVQGSLEMTGDDVIIGSALAERLQVTIGDEVTLYAPGNIKAIIDELHREQEDPQAPKKTLADFQNGIALPSGKKVVGLFHSGTNTFDAAFVLTPLFAGQELYGLRENVHGISVNTADPYHLEDVRRRIDIMLGGEASAISWMEGENRQRFDAIRLERQVMFIILFLIVVVAAFGIANTMITVTVQKTREIGIMKALGARTWQIVWVFLAQGMCVGAGGTLVGLLTGLTALHFRNPFRDWLSTTLHMEIFPSGIYEFDGIPAEVVPRDIAVICVGGFLICSLAALAPALMAARLDPVKALRVD